MLWLLLAVFFTPSPEIVHTRARSLRVDYETDCMSQVAEDHPIGFNRVEDLAWSEVDDSDHLRRMEESVYPRILENDRTYHG